MRSIWTQPVAAGLSPERLARILRDAAEPGGDTRDYLTFAEEIEEREPHLIIRNGARAMIKYSVGETPDLAKAGGFGLAAAVSDYTNPEFVQASVPVLQQYAVQLTSFFNHSPEMRAYVEWALRILEADKKDRE